MYLLLPCSLFKSAAEIFVSISIEYRRLSTAYTSARECQSALCSKTTIGQRFSILSQNMDATFNVSAVMALTNIDNAL